MFKLIVLLLFLIFIYFILSGEKRAVNFTVIIYFTLLSVIFLFGISKISDKYHLDDGPALDDGFQSLSEWVGIFSYLYIIPSFIIIAYILLRLAKRLFVNTWVKVTIYLLWLVALIVI